ncbi:MAG TPA: YsnF/AvaK domain-containing protein [Telluria sp.]
MHTLVAVFDNNSDAQKAKADLLASGFNSSDVRLSAGGTEAGATTTANHDESIGDSISNFFSDLFGNGSNDGTRDRAGVYSNAVSRGNCVLTVTTQSEDEVERAADLVERYGPIDIDEKSSEWSSDSTSGMSAGAMAGTQHSTQQSMQSGSSATMGSGTRSAQGMNTGNSRQFAESDSQAIPVVREELKIGKREVQRGGVRVYSHVVEEPVSESVNLREEHVKVERRPVDQAIDPSNMQAFQEASIEVRESAEEAVVQKSARVVEEVVVGKEVSNRQEQVRDTVRHTEVEVEKLGGTDKLSGSNNFSGNNDDSYYRSHWNSNYASSGKSYDEFAPAYQYGSTARNSDMYRGRPWEEIEPNLRSDWTARNPGSTWESMKAAVRHGWDRLTN